MKRLVILISLFSIPALARGPFDGTWKLDTAKVSTPSKPEHFQVGGGRFVCFLCVPKIDIKADGNDQPIAGDPYSNTLAAKIVDERTVETTSKKNGKVTSTSRYLVSADGNTLTIEWKFINSNQKQGGGTTVYQRIGSPTPAANLVTGEWQVKKLPSATDSVLLFTFKSSGDELSFIAPTGGHYTAKMDGADYPYFGDPGTTSVSLKKIDNRSFEETDKRNGEPVNVFHLTVSPDGNSLTIAVDNKINQQHFTWIAQKQSAATPQ